MMHKGVVWGMLGLVLWLGGRSEAIGQMEVEENLPAFDAVQLLAGRGIKTRGERYAGAPEAIGTLTNSGTAPAFEKALILSTGKASGFVGPNNRPKTSSSMMTPGNRDLNTLANSRTFDAAILDFDFMTDRDSFALNFYYASEEYSEFVGSTFQDVVVVLLKGPGLGNGKILSVVPGTQQPIHANTVSINKNRRYYIDNNPFNLNGQINETQKAKLNPELLAACQYDGLTRVFSVGSRVQPKTKYHLQVVVADAGDGDNDSAVILEANSMQSYEQYWRTVRRREIAAQRRADSLAVVQARQDSIAAALTAYQDSLMAAERPALVKEGQVPDGGEGGETEPTEDVVDASDFEDPFADDSEATTSTRTEAPAYKSDLADYLGSYPEDIQLTAEFEGDEFLLSETQKLQIHDLVTYLQQEPGMKVGLFAPENAQRRKLRSDLVRMEMITAGLAPERIFENGFSFFSSAEEGETTVERVEIWVR